MEHNTLLLFSSALMMGLLGGAHCISMCGGIICSLCYSCDKAQTQAWRQLRYQLAFNLGRLMTYTLLGALTGLLGMMISHYLGASGAYFLRYLSSVMIILVCVYIAGWWQWISALEKFGKLIWRPISRFTRYLLPVTKLRYALLLGNLWGFLPCGLIYSALLFSLSANNALAGAGVMLSFGLGTLPALILVGSAMQSYQVLTNKFWVRQLSGISMIVFGLAPFVVILQHASSSEVKCHQEISKSTAAISLMH